VRQTRQEKRGPTKFEMYETTSTAASLANGRITLSIHYGPARNPHMVDENDWRGTTTLVLGAADHKGKATWTKDFDGSHDRLVNFVVLAAEPEVDTQRRIVV